MTDDSLRIVQAMGKEAAPHRSYLASNQSLTLLRPDGQDELIVG